MIVFPNAKINIGLNIVEKRSDGYHNIESVFYPIALRDALEVIENKEQTNSPVIFSSSGIDVPGEAHDNLCVRAYDLIKRDYALPNIKIHLHKHIPIGAGLGGGSSDAAFFIKLINEKFNLQLSIEQMQNYAAKLGSDCPFFINNKPVFAQGTGTDFSPATINLKGYYITLVYPYLHVNTAHAYKGCIPQKPKRILKDDISLPVEEWKNCIHNQFEDTVFIHFSELNEIKSKLYSLGAIYAAMSGSGSSVYGIFKEKQSLTKQFENAFIYEGEL
jgi:4-diphosphocytidyl-2-C-methyl-D-erythritol kinase